MGLQAPPASLPNQGSTCLSVEIETLPASMQDLMVYLKNKKNTLFFILTDGPCNFIEIISYNRM